VQCVCCSLGGGYSYCAVDNLVGERANRRLQQAVYAARHQYHDQEAGEAEAGSLLVHGPAGSADLAVHRAVVRRRELRAVPRQPVQSVRVADRGPRERAELHQRLHDAQQSMVFTRCLYASGMRHFAEVRPARPAVSTSVIWVAGVDFHPDLGSGPDHF